MKYHVIDYDTAVDLASRGKLDDVSKEIILLSVVAGFKSHEIGKIMDLPSATVRTKQKRALSKLREELEL